ncbi:MAG: hypothetical protein IKC17_04415 [Bacteroidales bacterium]|nr:hypothetical protein [Bacteroidales bacterium]
MKKTLPIFFLTLLFFSVSCTRSIKNQEISSYIRSYQKIENFSHYYLANPGESESSFSNRVVKFLFLSCENILNVGCVHSLRDEEVVMYDKSGSCEKSASVYDSLRNHYGDTNCPDIFRPDLSEYTDCSTPSALIDEIVSIVITSDVDWDETHPSGTSLNDIVRVGFASHYPYIQSGYDSKYCVYDGTDKFYSEIKPIVELEDNDLVLLDTNSSLDFYFNLPSHIPACTLNFIFFTASQEQFTATVELSL